MANSAFNSFITSKLVHVMSYILNNKKIVLAGINLTCLHSTSLSLFLSFSLCFSFYVVSFAMQIRFPLDVNIVFSYYFSRDPVINQLKSRSTSFPSICWRPVQNFSNLLWPSAILFPSVNSILKLSLLLKYIFVIES